MPDPPPAWREVRRVSVTGSTNADLVADALAGEPAGLVLVADQQTAGRGRLGRSWSAPAGSGLAVSVLLRPVVAPNRLGWLPLVTGLAVVDAVRDSAGIAAVLKWPNDVVVGTDGRKLAGILAERVGGTDAVVVGVGLNVAMTAEQLPVPTATSLALELAPAGPPGLDDVLSTLLARLGARVDAWAGGDDQAAEYRAACVTLGRDVRVEVPARGVLEGRALDVDDTGRLLVDVGGRVEPIAAGDVTDAGGSAEG